MMVETTVMSAEPLVLETKARISRQVDELKRDKGITPKLVALLVGKDPVSRTYVDLKRNDCSEVGILSEVRDLSDLPKEQVREKLLSLIQELNADASVSAVIPQLPFDGRAKEEEVFSLLSPDKDADGMTPFRLGKLLRREYSLESSLLPCTPKGIVLLLRHYNVTIKGADTAIIGRSALVGEPLRKLLQDLDATATCYHTHSKHTKERIKEADIVVAASGRPPEIYGDSGFRVSSEMVKKGSVVVGVGVRRDERTGKMLFDVDTRSLRGHCSFVTPNTGGVGAMTRTALIENTIIAAMLQARTP